jgi:hypothetical protein
VDGRQRVGRQRPRPLDWVVAATRPPLARRTASRPRLRVVGPSFQEWISSFWAPNLRVLEVCQTEPTLLADAARNRASDYVCLTPPGVRRRSEEVGRLGWTMLQGEPNALGRLNVRFDLIAWLRDEERPTAMFEVAERLLHPDGILAARTSKRLDARLGSRWRFGDLAGLNDGSLGIRARRRRRAQAA